MRDGDAYRLLIGSGWLPASDGAELDVVNPATEQRIGSVPRATAKDLDAALDAAWHGWQRWRATDAWSRSDVLRKAAALLRHDLDRLARIMTEEQGKPLRESVGELTECARQLDWFADEARRIYGRVVPAARANRHQFVVREPIGPVAAFTAWNFPALLAVRKLAPALAAGCSVIVKPAEEAPFTAYELAAILRRAGLPDGALNVVTGDPAVISAHLLADGRVRKASFTGSIPVGQHLLRLAAENVIDVSMELGGHAPVVVLGDADPVKVARKCVAAKFRNAGQVCVSPSRFYVAGQIVDQFAEAFAEASRSLALGPGTDDSTDIGPLSNQRRLDAIEELVADAVAGGARVLSGGRRSPAHARGYFYEPTVLSTVAPDARVLRDEPFGPVAPVVAIESAEEALQLANATSYGLAGYVFTDRLRDAFAIAEGLEVGMVGINTFEAFTSELPFGGVKRSGIGRESGAEAIDNYTIAKSVVVDLT
jgi:succinate-semialdehyde dehydrogenase/glutarate-semialdehyde dehydrogenase